MIRETEYIRSYPSKSVIEDLIMRDGPATDKDFTPFEGKKEIVDGQFSGSQRHKFRINDFIQHNKNRDLDPSRIKESNYYGQLEEAGMGFAGYTTLEDMMEGGVESPAVADYVKMLCVGFKKDNTSPYRKNADVLTRTVRNIDGDGDDAIEEKYMVNRSDEQQISNEEYEQIVKELPYIIKSIWHYSKLYQANLFSFAFAYYDIISKKSRNKVIVTDFRDYTTYQIRKDGSYLREFVHEDDNKYIIYPKVTKIFIIPDSHITEYSLCMKFLESLKKLGIDYRDEDPASYNNEFVNSIVCTYLPSNEQYFNEYKDVDAEIIIALKPENILATTKTSLYAPVFDGKSGFDYSQSAYFVSERIKMAYRFGEIEDTLIEVDKEAAIELLQVVLAIKSGKDDIAVPRQLVSFESDGFLYVNKQILTVPGQYFGCFKGDTDYVVAITQYGFIVALEESYDDVYFMEYHDAMSQMEEYKRDGEVQCAAGWKSF